MLDRRHILIRDNVNGHSCSWMNFWQRRNSGPDNRPRVAR
jgi:hypothetical protein